MNYGYLISINHKFAKYAMVFYVGKFSATPVGNESLIPYVVAVNEMNLALKPRKLFEHKGRYKITAVGDYIDLRSITVINGSP